MIFNKLATFSLILMLSGSPGALANDHNKAHSMIPEDLAAVSPALKIYYERFLENDLWKNAALSPRDRSFVTISALVAMNQTAAMPEQLRLALDNGVKPSELSEVVMHLALYTGLANANSAAGTLRKVFEDRGIGADQLAPASPDLIPLNVEAEATRVARVAKNLGPTFQDLQDYTTDVLFKDLWLRPGLAPRDRSLMTVSALVATGRVAQLTSHINLGMDNGLTQGQIAGAITHLAFYSGWPNAMSAAPVANEVFGKRSG
jgi:4-carboxymuconolactone decarboxylase